MMRDLMSSDWSDQLSEFRLDLAEIADRALEDVHGRKLIVSSDKRESLGRALDPTAPAQWLLGSAAATRSSGALGRPCWVSSCSASELNVTITNRLSSKTASMSNWPPIAST
jgi:hypothetical protein